MFLRSASARTRLVVLAITSRHGDNLTPAQRLVDICPEHSVSLIHSADVYSGGLLETILRTAIKGKRSAC